MWDSILAYMWEAGLKAFREVLDKQDKKSIPTEDSVKMTEFVLKNNFYEFKIKIKQQVSGTAISTKFTPPYACLLSLRKVSWNATIATSSMTQMERWYFLYMDAWWGRTLHFFEKP